MSKFKVFVRVVGTVAMDVDADSPEEASEIASDEIAEEKKIRFLQMDVDDLETYFPVAYNDPDSGNTIDFVVPDNYRELEAGNALVGLEMWALSELTTDENGIVGDPKVSIFFSARKAFKEMEHRYEAENAAFESGRGDIDMFMPPEEGEDGCYISAKKGPCITWSITRAKIE